MGGSEKSWRMESVRVCERVDYGQASTYGRTMSTQRRSSITEDRAESLPKLVCDGLSNFSGNL